MFVKQMYTGCLAQAAYYIESKGEVAIIDPMRETEPYTKMAAERGAKIKYILETHFHADFVSGHVDLAEKTGAKVIYGPTASANYDIYVATDGEELELGDVTLKVLHTPGHTMESTTYLLRDEDGKDQAIFTGDTLFIGDVGRPDLAVKSDLTMEDLAGHLYESLHNKIMPLDDEVMVYPGHGAGSACGKHMSNQTSATLGQQKQFNYALQDLTKEDFIKQVTDGLKQPPQYFPKNVMLNKQGYSDIDSVIENGTKPLDTATVSDWQDEGAIILDTRSPQDFAEGFVPGSLNIGIDGQFASWVGTLIPDLTRPIVIIANEGSEEEAVTRLARVGYDNTVGYLKGGVTAWVNSGMPLDKMEQVNPTELEDLVKAGASVVDVRRAGEYETLHVKDAQNIPLDDINERYYELDKDKQYYLHCKSGYRSMIMSSMLRSIGYDNVVNITEGFEGIEQTNIATASGVEVA